MKTIVKNRSQVNTSYLGGMRPATAGRMQIRLLVEYAKQASVRQEVIHSGVPKLGLSALSNIVICCLQRLKNLLVETGGPSLRLRQQL